jgi:hypothetical protein
MSLSRSMPQSCTRRHYLSEWCVSVIGVIMSSHPVYGPGKGLIEVRRRHQGLCLMVKTIQALVVGEDKSTEWKVSRGLKYDRVL